MKKLILLFIIIGNIIIHNNIAICDISKDERDYYDSKYKTGDISFFSDKYEELNCINNKSEKCLYIELCIAKHDFDKKKYKEAFQKFIKISKEREGKITAESTFYIGQIYELYHKNDDKAYDAYEKAMFSGDNQLKKIVQKPYKKLQKKIFKNIKSECVLLNFDVAINKCQVTNIKDGICRYLKDAKDSKDSFNNSISNIKNNLKSQQSSNLQSQIKILKKSYNSMKNMKNTIGVNDTLFNNIFKIPYTFWENIANSYIQYMDAKNQKNWPIAINTLSKIISKEFTDKSLQNDFKNLYIEAIRNGFDRIYAKRNDREKYNSLKISYRNHYSKLDENQKKKFDCFINYYEGKRDKDVSKLKKAYFCSKQHKNYNVKKTLFTQHLNEAGSILKRINKLNTTDYNFWNYYNKHVDNAEIVINNEAYPIKNQIKERKLLNKYSSIQLDIEKLQKILILCTDAEQLIKKKDYINAKDDYDAALKETAGLPTNVRQVIISKINEGLKIINNEKTVIVSDINLIETDPKLTTTQRRKVKRLVDEGWSLFKAFKYEKAKAKFNQAAKISKDPKLLERVKHMNYLIRAEKNIKNVQYIKGCSQKNYDKIRVETENFFGSKLFWYPNSSSSEIHKKYFLYLNEVAVGDCLQKQRNFKRALAFYKSAINKAITEEEKKIVQNKIEKITGKKVKTVSGTNKLDELFTLVNTNPSAVTDKKIENLISYLQKQIQTIGNKKKFVIDASEQILAIAKMMKKSGYSKLSETLVIQFLGSGIIKKIDCKSGCEVIRKKLQEMM